MTEIPATLLEASRYFADPARCNEFMREIKWPRGKVSCPKCGCESVSDVKGRPKLQCNSREWRDELVSWRDSRAA